MNESGLSDVTLLDASGLYTDAKRIQKKLKYYVKALSNIP